MTVWSLLLPVVQTGVEPVLAKLDNVHQSSLHMDSSHSWHLRAFCWPQSALESKCWADSPFLLRSPTLLILPLVFLMFQQLSPKCIGCGEAAMLQQKACVYAFQPPEYCLFYEGLLLWVSNILMAVQHPQKLQPWVAEKASEFVHLRLRDIYLTPGLFSGHEVSPIVSLPQSVCGGTGFFSALHYLGGSSCCLHLFLVSL